MNSYFRKINRNAELIFANSKDYQATKNDWLPGGMLTAIWGEVIGAMDKNSIVIDEIRKWSVFTISKNNKKIVFITIYRISQSSN